MVERVGIRELNQHTSAVMKRVKAGHTVEVTEHGRPVALIVPAQRPDDVVGRLVAEGRAIPARGDLLELMPPPRRRRSRRPLSEVVSEMRDEDDR